MTGPRSGQSPRHWPPTVRGEIDSGPSSLRGCLARRGFHPSSEIGLYRLGAEKTGPSPRDFAELPASVAPRDTTIPQQPFPSRWLCAQTDMGTMPRQVYVAAPLRDGSNKDEVQLSRSRLGPICVHIAHPGLLPA